MFQTALNGLADLVDVPPSGNSVSLFHFARGEPHFETSAKGLQDEEQESLAYLRPIFFPGIDSFYP